MNLTPEQMEKCAPDHPIFFVLERLKLVQDKLVAADPEIGTHLKAIHTHLRDYEELAHLLSPAQIGVLMKGLQKYTAISLVVEDQNKGTRKKKPTADDLL